MIFQIRKHIEKALKQMNVNDIPVSLLDSNGSLISYDEQAALVTQHLHLWNTGFGFEHNYVDKAEEVLKLWSICLDVKCDKLKEQLLSEMRKKQFQSNDNIRFTFIDLFAGIGGFRMALQNVGGECLFSSEWDESAQKTYYENYGDVPFGDITKIDPNFIPDFDVLTGGFPCQPFSSIGKREGFRHRTQGTLFFYIAEIIRVKHPRAFILENVPGLLTHEEGKTYETIMDVLQNELNYKVYPKVLNSADFGVPQERKRLYFIGFRNDIDTTNYQIPEGTGEKVGIGKFVETEAHGPCISEHLQKSYIFKKDDGHPQIIDSNSDFPVKTLCASYHKIQRITGTFVRGGDTGLRLLTENECKAIMGYPKDFRVPVSRTQMYHQFGNSVAVPVVQRLAESVVNTIVGQE